MNLYQRMAAVMEDVRYLQKDDEVEAGRGKTYKAVTEEKVTGTIRESLIKHGIVVFPASMQTAVTSETVQTRDGERINRLTHIDVVYTMANKDDPAEAIQVASSGTGVDTQDKGIGKAMTYAYKYMLLRTFAIPTGEDPDAISSDVYTERLTDGAKGKKKPEQKQELAPNVPAADQDDSDEAREKVRRLLYKLGDGDVSRVVTYAEAIYPGVQFETMNIRQLTNVKVRLAKKIAESKK